jgi:hypothetical protein
LSKASSFAFLNELLSDVDPEEKYLIVYSATLGLLGVMWRACPPDHHSNTLELVGLFMITIKANGIIRIIIHM